MITRPPHIAAGLCLLGCLLLQGCATPGRVSDIDNACRIFSDNPDWRVAMENTRDRWRTPVHVQLAIMRQESSFRHDARPPRATVLGMPMPWRKSSAFGFSQAKDSTWDWYQTKTGNIFASRDNFADASDFIGWYTDVSHRILGLSKWDAYSQYLAYHEGHGGYRRKTYLKKSWLMSVAQRVKTQSLRYATQLKACP